MQRGAYSRSTNPYFDPHHKFEVDDTGLQYCILDHVPQGIKQPRHIVKEFRNRAAAIMSRRELQARDLDKHYFIWDRCTRKLLNECS